jgi:hypothetical protein
MIIFDSDYLFDAYFSSADPYCLFCSNHIDDCKSENTQFYSTTNYNCVGCNEIFIDMYFYGAPKTENQFFIFTCNDLQVNLNTKGKTIQINRLPITFPPSGKKLDYFPLNFENKKSLYDKLKTYQLFT